MFGQINCSVGSLTNFLSFSNLYLDNFVVILDIAGLIGDEELLLKQIVFHHLRL
jgi:hypothetical protein